VQQPQALRPQAASRDAEVASQDERTVCRLDATGPAGQAAIQVVWALLALQAALRSTVEPSRQSGQLRDVRAGPLAVTERRLARKMSFVAHWWKREPSKKQASAQHAPGW